MRRRRMERNPKLSIVIVSFNSQKYIDGCLSALQKTIPSDVKFEVLIFDNASTDGSFSHIKKTYKNVYAYRSEENLGFAKANNFLIKKSRGEYILLLNPDTEIKEKTIEMLISYMETHPEAGAVTPRVVLPNGKLDDASHRGFPTPWNAFCYFTGISKVFPHSRLLNGYHLGYEDMDKVHEIDSGVGACLLIRKKAGEEVKWLDEDYFWYGEDLDFCYRLKENGWKIVFIPQVRVLHYKGASSGIKKHFPPAASVSYETKVKATQARFDVMKIFYKKHYQKKYPFFIRYMVLWSIDVKRWWILHSL